MPAAQMQQDASLLAGPEIMFAELPGQANDDVKMVWSGVPDGRCMMLALPG